MIRVTWTEKKKQIAIDMLTKYFERHGTGESIAQGDNAQFEAIELVCSIADNALKKGIKYIEDED